jgi:ABC-type antimicrobial peptide transport system permease subunit
VAQTFAELKFVAIVSGGLTLAAGTLVAIGILTSARESVLRRRFEIGVRAAVGAPPHALIWMLSRRLVLTLVVSSIAGIWIGGIGARAFRSMLFEFGPSDPLIVMGTLILIGILSIAAVVSPLARAARRPPIENLRIENNR